MKDSEVSENNSDFNIIKSFMRVIAFVFTSESQVGTDKVREVAFQVEEIP